MSRASGWRPLPRIKDPVGRVNARFIFKTTGFRTADTRIPGSVHAEPEAFIEKAPYGNVLYS
jgi:hypothetical protein